MNEKEKAHLQRIKEMPCGCCGKAGPSSAHHVLGDDHRRVSHFLTIPLCYDCHQDPFLGIHGQKRTWLMYKKTEKQVIAETIEALVA